MKQFTIHILIVLILCGVFCDGYFTVSQLSCGRVWLSDSEVYAADDWEAVTQDDLVTAFQYYCKSRNLIIDGSIADALTSFTTTTFNKICNTLGINVNSLQANLKKTVEGNLGLRFLMNQQGVLAYNRIFAEFLQNNDLAVGDSVDDSLFDGKFYDDGTNKSLIWVMPKVSNDSANVFPIVYGSNYIYSGSDILNIMSTNSYSSYDLQIPVIGINSSNLVSHTFYYYQNAPNSDLRQVVKDYQTNTNWSWGTIIYANYEQVSTVYDGGIFLYTVPDSNTIYLGKYIDITSSNNTFYWSRFANSTSVDTQNVNITINNYNGDTINNNDYSKDYTIFYNDGDYYEDDDEPDPTTPPDGGGDPDQPSPSGPDLPDWGSPNGSGTIGSDGTFDFDIPFSLPDLNIDWSLKNIGNKFPFCIPSDIVSFYQVLAVEPEAPAIDAHIPLGSFYDWHFEADFSQYDNWARIIRIVEYVGFVITLIYFTVKLVKG